MKTTVMVQIVIAKVIRNASRKYEMQITVKPV